MQDSSQYADLLFALNPVDPTDAITAMATPEYTWGDLPAGDHTVYIYHANGCTTFVDFTTDSYEPLTLSAIKSGPNEITATAFGGYGGYEYFFQEGRGHEFAVARFARVSISPQGEIALLGLADREKTPIE